MFGHVFLLLVASVTLAARHLPLPHLHPSPLHPALPVVSNRFIPRGLACRRGRKASRFLIAQPLLRCLLVPDTRNLGNYVSLRGIEGIAFTCPGSMPKWEPITFEESLSFVKKIKASDYMLYLSLLDVLNRNDQIPLEAYG